MKAKNVTVFWLKKIMIYKRFLFLHFFNFEVQHLKIKEALPFFPPYIAAFCTVVTRLHAISFQRERSVHRFFIQLGYWQVRVAVSVLDLGPRLHSFKKIAPLSYWPGKEHACHGLGRDLS